MNGQVYVMEPQDSLDGFDCDKDVSSNTGVTSTVVVENSLDGFECDKDATSNTGTRSRDTIHQPLEKYQ